MNGKSKCKILKDIRREIAKQNDIEYITSECKFQGECSGTCPKCEAEVKYLEDELAKRKNAGKAIAVAGIAAALMIGISGCTPDNPLPSNTLAGAPAVSQTETTEAIEGELVPGDWETLPGVPTEGPYLIGDVPYEADPTAPLLGEVAGDN